MNSKQRRTLIRKARRETTSPICGFFEALEWRRFNRWYDRSIRLGELRRRLEELLQYTPAKDGNARSRKKYVNNTGMPIPPGCGNRDCPERYKHKNAEEVGDLFRFQGTSYLVPAHRHTNPDGSLGGWVAETASVAKTAFVGWFAQIYESAQVSGHAHIAGEALIRGNARIYGTAELIASVVVSDEALIEKPEDVQHAEGWTAFRTRTGIKFHEHWKHEYQKLASWGELPRVLLDCGLISVTEYLARSVPEQELERVP